MQDEIIDIDNPYEDYDVYELEVKEISTRTIYVFAKDAKSGAKYVREMCLNEIDFEGNTDKYEKVVEIADENPVYCGFGTEDFTVSPWWYD